MENREKESCVCLCIYCVLRYTHNSSATKQPPRVYAFYARTQNNQLYKQSIYTGIYCIHSDDEITHSVVSVCLYKNNIKAIYICNIYRK